MEKDSETEGFGVKGQSWEQIACPAAGLMFFLQAQCTAPTPSIHREHLQSEKSPFDCLRCRILVWSKTFPARCVLALQPQVGRILAALPLAEAAEHSQTAAAEQALHLEVSEFARLIAHQCSLRAPVNC